ncbi:MAG: hypothetical protein ABIS86_13580 [Streptosporangiaceae bacterium]
MGISFSEHEGGGVGVEEVRPRQATWSSGDWADRAEAVRRRSASRPSPTALAL